MCWWNVSLVVLLELDEDELLSWIVWKTISPMSVGADVVAFVGLVDVSRMVVW